MDLTVPNPVPGWGDVPVSAMVGQRLSGRMGSRGGEEGLLSQPYARARPSARPWLRLPSCQGSATEDEPGVELSREQ